MWEGKRPSDDLNFYSLLGIVQCGIWLQSDLEKYLLSYDLSFGRFSILLAILESEGKVITGNDISIKLGLSKPTITKLVNKLLENNLIEYKVDDLDLRKKRLLLTRDGKKVLEKTIPGYLERMRIIGANISIDEKQLLLKVLNKVNYLDTRKVISQYNERPIGEVSKEIEELCKKGRPEDIDQVMSYLNETVDIPMTKVIDYYLGTISSITGMKQIEYYLFNGSQIQRNFAALFFVRINDWKLVNKAYKLGLIDYIQAYSK